MTIKSQKVISGLIESMLSRKAAYPAKNGVSRMRSRSLLWAIGFERFNQRLQKRNVFLIRCSQNCLRNRSCSSMPLRGRSEEHTSELQSRFDLVCRLLLEKKKQK